MRKEKTVTFDDDGNQLTFRIRQMSATQLESWVIRLGLLFAGSGGKIDVPSDGGIGAVIEAFRRNPMTVLSGVKYEDLRPLYDELLDEVERIDGKIAVKCTPDVLDSFVGDFKTLFQLRWEVLKLNFNFFSPTVGQSNTQFSTPTIKAGGVKK